MGGEAAAHAILDMTVNKMLQVGKRGILTEHFMFIQTFCAIWGFLPDKYA